MVEYPSQRTPQNGPHYDGLQSIARSRPLHLEYPTEHFVEVDLPPSEQDVGYPGPALMHIALWMPDVEPGTKVPVIATIHPYYDFWGRRVAGDDSNPNTIPDAGVGAG